MKPTIGRIVHYTNLGDADGRYPPEQQAAIITKVEFKGGRELKDNEDDEHQYDVWLHIFYATGDFFMERVPFHFAYKRGHWTWPKREEDKPTYTITINGRQHEVHANFMTYDELVKLSGLVGHPTMTWRTEAGKSGTLAPGEQLTVAYEPIINVCHTDNA